VRSSSNPAFRNLPTGGGYGGYAGFGQQEAGYQQAPPPLTSERPMTIDDVVTKTGITLGVVTAGAVVTYVTGLYNLAFPAAIIGLVLALIIMFKRMPSPPLVLAYAAVEGVFLGGFSGIIGGMIDGWTQNPGQGLVVIGQAIIGTLGVFFGMLVVYKTGAIRVTPKFTKWITGAIIGVGVLMLFNLILSFFNGGGGIGIRSGGTLAIIFSLVCIGLAAFSFLIDFDAADQAIRAGVPAKFAWQIAFGLTVTLVWLYTEILRLLSYFNSD
jgi:uncharacterized YccA/Bax inhibitor family protein